MTRPVLIVSRPGPLRESLQALLATVLPAGAIEVVDDTATALTMVAKDRPALVVLDFDPSDDSVWELLSRIQVTHPRIRCVVLVDDMQQRERVLSFCAEEVVMKGCRAEQLSATIRHTMFEDGSHRTPSIHPV